VNYRINDDGSYNTKAPGIETINVVAVVDISFPEWKIAKVHIGMRRRQQRRVRNAVVVYRLEDVRVFFNGG
jgi:hypothetical protein